jgi:hypothetical protein
LKQHREVPSAAMGRLHRFFSILTFGGTRVKYYMRIPYDKEVKNKSSDMRLF